MLLWVYFTSNGFISQIDIKLNKKPWKDENSTIFFAIKFSF